MKKWLAVSAAFVSVYMVFLIAFLPANFVVNKVKLPKNIQVGPVSGTIWHSKIDSLLVERTVINNVNVHVNWLSLIAFNPTVDIEFGGALYAGPEGKVRVSGVLSDLAITDLQLEISANEIAQQLPLPIPAQAKNIVSVTIDEFVLGQPVCQQLSGNVKWDNAAIIALSELVPLGTLSAKLTCEEGKGLVVLDKNNDLGVTFTAEIGTNGAISGNGYLTPHQNLPKAIEQVLPFLGRQDREGRYRLMF
ncbi:type II secretion system protein N [Thalassotalea profundi]|uniref:Type II secretion system protein N n=1 Tax=Thalassotalea profundi TaxID=2036687 RepID=A0ABQ3J3F8_9GAMM|nr:type II secretion system protein N [Thalassotalea profundi]GHE99883.1 type II secretion protein N [Thalassotalea profundi]